MKEIFIVEDDHDIRELIEFLLVGSYQIRAFPSAEAFINTISSQIIHLGHWLRVKKGQIRKSKIPVDKGF